MVVLVEFVCLDPQNDLPETSNRCQYHQWHSNKNARLKNMYSAEKNEKVKQSHSIEEKKKVSLGSLINLFLPSW